MAMSQGERLWRLQQSSNRYLSRQQTTSSWNHTREIVQPRSSGVVFPATKTPTNQAIQNTVVRMGSEVPGGTDSAITKNVYNATGAPIGCSANVVTSGSETFDEANALIQKAQSVRCCNKINEYWNYNGYSIDVTGGKDLSGGFITGIKGGVCCPLPNLVNNAQLPNWVKCSYCLNFYNPTVSAKCCYGTPYPSSQLYPRQPIDWELRRYGDDRVPEGCGPAPTITNFGIVGVIPGTGPWQVAWTQTNTQTVGVVVYDGNNQIYPAVITYDSLSQVTIADFTNTGDSATYTVVVTATNDCGSVTQSGTFLVRGSR